MRLKPDKTGRTTQNASVPPLHNGDRLTQAEFHRRYQAAPENLKAELIRGEVVMPSPVRAFHSEYHFELTMPLGIYKAFTPGVVGATEPTTILGPRQEPQPDLTLRILSECRGQVTVNQDNYYEGAPEFLAEIAHSSKSIDLGAKRADYMSSGVQEYLVLCVEECELHWFHFPSKGKLRPKKGIWKSRVMPGLWLDAEALFASNTARVIQVVQEGIADPEHLEFVEALARQRARQ